MAYLVDLRLGMGGRCWIAFNKHFACRRDETEREIMSYVRYLLREEHPSTKRKYMDELENWRDYRRQHLVQLNSYGYYETPETAELLADSFNKSWVTGDYRTA